MVEANSELPRENATPVTRIELTAKRVCTGHSLYSGSQTGISGPTLHESTHNGLLQIMHPTTFHIKNPSDAKLASLSILRKWPVSMATIVKIEKYKSDISQHIFKLFSQY